MVLSRRSRYGNAMETHRRGANGKRLFTAEFKREQVGRLARGEVSVAELSRELQVSDSLLRRWKHLAGEGARAAVAAHEEVVPLSELRAAEARIRELERALGRKTMENEILRAAQDEVKKWFFTECRGRPRGS